MHQAEDAADDGDRDVELDVAFHEGIAVGIKTQRPDEKDPGNGRCHACGDLEAPECRGVADRGPAHAKPSDRPNYGDAAEQHGQEQREDERRNIIMGCSDRHRIKQQDQIEQRNLTGHRMILREDQFRIIGRNFEDRDRIAIAKHPRMYFRS